MSLYLTHCTRIKRDSLETTAFKSMVKSKVKGMVKWFGDSSQKTNLKTNLKNDQKILGLIRQNSRITAKELVQATGLSLAGVKYNLNKLKKENVLKRVSLDKGGHWEVSG